MAHPPGLLRRPPTPLRALPLFLALALPLAAGCTATAIAPLAQSHNAIGSDLLVNGELDRAEANFRLALEYAPGMAEARMNLGLVAFRRGHLEEAERELLAALGLREDFTEAWGNLGAVLEAEGRSGEAQDAYERALAIHPGLAFARRNLGRLLIEGGRHESARAHLLRLVETDSSDLEARALLAWCELYLGRADAGRAALSGVLEVEDAPPLAHLVAGILALRDGELAAAEDHLVQAERDPRLAHEVTLRRAAVDVILGDPEAAMARLAPMLEADPFDAAAHLIVAHAARSLGDLESARAHAAAALELAPGLGEAERLLSDVP